MTKATPCDDLKKRGEERTIAVDSKRRRIVRKCLRHE